MKLALSIASILLVFGTLASAAPMFPQCPPVGANTGCEFLITVNSNGTTTVAADPNPPNNGPYDGSDDVLVGVLNNSSTTVTSLPLMSNTNAFGFENDGACSGTFGSTTNGNPPAAQCQGGVFTTTDPADYESVGATFSNINSGMTAATVFLSLAPGQSTWFSLEGALTASNITPGPVGSGVPEPASIALIGIGLCGLGLLRRTRKSQ
jgi:hypothetical protein